MRRKAKKEQLPVKPNDEDEDEIKKRLENEDEDEDEIKKRIENENDDEIKKKRIIEEPAIEEQAATEIPDHTHPEYDQLLIMVQELSDRINEIEMKGQQEDTLEMGEQADNDKTKKDEVDEKKKEEEDLAGQPERDTSETKEKPMKTKELPNTAQPPAGTPITPEEAEKDATKKATIPKDLPKQPIITNKVNPALVGRKSMVGTGAALLAESNAESEGIKTAREYLNKVSVRFS